MQLSIDDQRDLRDYWTGSLESQMGLKSSFGCIMDRIRSGLSRDSSVHGMEPSEYQLVAVHRWRKVHERISKLSREHSAILGAYYCASKNVDLPIFGPYALVASLYKSTDKLRRLVKQAKHNQRDRACLLALVAQCKAQVDEAHKAYSKAGIK